MIEKWYGCHDSRFIKMITEDGETIIRHRGRRMNFGKGIDGLRRALHYIDLQRFLAKVEGKAIGSREHRPFPVRSLTPQTRVRTIHVLEIVEEVV